jgi:transposase InsO family protein
LAIIAFPDERRRGAVTGFCRENGVSTSVFYKIKAQARDHGPDAAASVRPPVARTIANRTSEQLERIALETRAELKRKGWDHGPLSVAAQMRRRGLEPPSRATLARVFTRNGQVAPQPRKRPRSSYRRWSDPRPNGTWQLDGTEWTLDADDGVRVILQVEDDHSRMVLASRVARSENTSDARAVVERAVTVWGPPVRFLTDNAIALNPQRRGRTGAIEKYLRPFGTRAITGRPGKPTTQGKNERLHRTLQRFLEAHRPITDDARLETLIAEFDDHYNTRRPHQSLEPDQTPWQAYHELPKAVPVPPEATPEPPHVKRPKPKTGDRAVDRSGRIRACGHVIQLGVEHAGQTIHFIADQTTLMIIDPDGVIIATFDRPTTPSTLHLWPRGSRKRTDIPGWRPTTRQPELPFDAPDPETQPTTIP